MTPEERERMNTLCLQIQQEKDYAKFEALSHELNDLVARKQRRFSERHSPLTSPSERAWKVMPAVAQQIIRPRYRDETELLEITIPEAEPLFREIRIGNSFVDSRGGVLSLTVGTRIDIRFEADAKGPVKTTNGHR